MSEPADRYFDDFHAGQRFEAGPVAVSEDDIVAFARLYDPQPFHIDRAAAASTRFRGLIASGFQTLSLSFGMFFRLRVIEKANLGSPGMEEVRWLLPLRPGDRIRIVAEVTETRRSQSKPDRGIVRMRHDTFNQRDELIMTVNCLHMLSVRPGA